MDPCLKSEGWATRQHQNSLGTEQLRTTYSGAVEATFNSLPFGDGSSTTGTDNDAYHYAVLDSDSTSVTDMAQFRRYSHAQGRWMSPDPYSGSYDSANPQSMNRYAYVLNSPTSFVDPLGLHPLITCEPGPVPSGYISAPELDAERSEQPNLGGLWYTIPGENGEPDQPTFIDGRCTFTNVPDPGTSSTSNVSGSSPGATGGAPNKNPPQPQAPKKNPCASYKTQISIDTDIAGFSGLTGGGIQLFLKNRFLRSLAPELWVVSGWALTDRAILRYVGNWEHGCTN